MQRRPWIANTLLALWLLTDAAIVVRFQMMAGAMWPNAFFVTGYAVQAGFVLGRGAAAETSLAPTHLAVVALSVLAPYAYLAVPDTDEGGQLTVATVVLGGALFLWSAISLRDKFSVFASRRAVVSVGPYAFIRHPIYLAYLVADFGFVATSRNILAWLIYAVAGILLFARSVEEERLLRNDPAYERYASRVRYRLIPYVL